MTTDVLTLLADAQFLLARALWEPQCDRERAARLADLAARTHPELAKRAAIVEWLARRDVAA